MTRSHILGHINLLNYQEYNLKILIDLQCCQSGSRLGGIGRYAMSLAKAMIRQETKHEFYILLNNNLGYKNEIRFELQNIIQQYKIIEFHAPINASYILKNYSKAFFSQLIREKFLCELNIDVVLIMSMIEGFSEDVVTSCGHMFPEEKTAVILYDLIPLIEKEKYITNVVIENFYYEKINFLKKSKIIMSISEYSKIEGINNLELDIDNVTNISSAADEIFVKRPITNKRKIEIFKKFEINNHFIMFVGSFDNRKNQSRLIEAYSKLPLNIINKYQLVIVGNGNDEIYNKLREICDYSNVPKNKLIFTGLIDDDELVDLLNLCDLFVFPSLREGFGLPVLEAMSCGKATIGSNTTSISEVIGKDECLFDPYDAKSISNLIKTVLENDDLKLSLEEYSLERSRDFSWETSAKKSIKFIENKTQRLSQTNDFNNISAIDNCFYYNRFLSKIKSYSGEYNLENRFLLESADCIESNDIIVEQFNNLLDINNNFKFGIITTWNTKCGIASYSHHMVTNSNKSYYIFAPLNGEILHEDNDRVNRCWKTGEDDLIRLNKEIIDCGIDSILIQFNYGFFKFNELKWLIINLKKNKKSVVLILHSTIDPPKEILNRQLSELKMALIQCDAILVHTLNDIENLKNIGIYDNIVFFPQGIVKHNQKFINKKKNSHFTISTFGYALPHKGLKETILATNEILKLNIDINLHMINARYPAEQSLNYINDCKNLIGSLGISDRVKFIDDYLNEEQIFEKLQNSNLIIFPYQNTNESSSSAVRMALSSKTLVSVSPLKIFDDINDLIFRMNGATVDDIKSSIISIKSMVENNSKIINDKLNKIDSWINFNSFNCQSKFLDHILCFHSKKNILKKSK